MLVQADSKRNFDETLEAHVKMTPDLRRTDLVISTYLVYLMNNKLLLYCTIL